MSWNEEIKKELKYCGTDVYIGDYVIFTNPQNVILHSRVRIDPFCLITTALIVGSSSHICSHAILGGGDQQKIILEGWNFIGYGSKLFTASEDYSGEHGAVCEFWGNNKIYRGDIIFSRFSGIASDVIVFPGIELPEGCTIGAKSFVYTKDNNILIPWSVWFGNPLRFHKSRNKNKIISSVNDKHWLKER